MENKAILSIKEVIAYLGIGRSMLLYKVDSTSKYFDASFPKLLKLGPRRVGFRKAEIDQWLENLDKAA